MNIVSSELRSLVTDIEGTTRDLVSSETIDFKLWDTAGIRLTKGKQELDYLSQERAKMIITRVDVIWLLVSYDDGPSLVDAKLIELVRDEAKNLIVVCNKWDLSKDKSTQEAKEFFGKFKTRINFDAHFPIIFVSCLESKGIDRLLKMSAELLANAKKDYNAGWWKKALAKSKLRIKEKVLFVQQLNRSPLHFLVSWKGLSITQSERRALKNLLYDTVPDSKGLSIKLSVKLRELRGEYKDADSKLKEYKPRRGHYQG